MECSNLVFNKDRLLDMAEAHHEAFVTADPFPHVVIDDFLPRAMADAVLAAFPSPDRMESFTRQRYENKIADRPDNPLFPPEIEAVLNALNGGKLIAFLETLTGIDRLLPDPHLAGGGLHQVLPGGKLGLHVDFNQHEGLGLYRRLNLLVYLNRDWPEEYGGHLELWDADVTECRKRVSPQFNRAVVFETTSTSWHGHPDPLRSPKGVNRRSLAMYYYTAEPGHQATDGHWTRHRRRPGSFSDHVKRPIEKALYELTPPVVHKAIRRLLSS